MATKLSQFLNIFLITKLLYALLSIVVIIGVVSVFRFFTSKEQKELVKSMKD